MEDMDQALFDLVQAMAKAEGASKEELLQIASEFLDKHPGNLLAVEDLAVVLLASPECQETRTVLQDIGDPLDLNMEELTASVQAHLAVCHSCRYLWDAMTWEPDISEDDGSFDRIVQEYIAALTPEERAKLDEESIK